METLNFLSAHWGVFSSIALIIVASVNILLTTKFVRRNDCKSYRKTLVDKASIENMPTAEVVSGLKLNMVKLSGRLAVINKEMQGNREILNIVKTQVDHIEGHLRKHKESL